MEGDVTETGKRDEKSAGETKRFDCLATFQEVNFTAEDAPICVEDIDNETELWLIKAPYNFDGKKLKAKNVSLSGCQLLDETEGSDVAYEILASQETQPDKGQGLPHVLFPSRQEASLMPAQAFKGQMSIVEKVVIPSILLPPSPPMRSNDLPLGLRQRFKPFGWEEPTKSLGRTEKSSDATDEGTAGGKRRKRKRDRKDKEAQEVADDEAAGPAEASQPLDQEPTVMDAETDGDDRKEHRKMKKRKKSLAQADPVEDSEMTPTKKKKKKRKDV